MNPALERNEEQTRGVATKEDSAHSTENMIQQDNTQAVLPSQVKQLTEIQMIQRIEGTAKVIGEVLHCGHSAFPISNPECKQALDYCTSILQQGGRRLSIGLPQGLENRSPQLDDNDLKRVSEALLNLSISELTGACFIMHYIYSRMKSRRNYHDFFVQDAFDPFQSTKAVGNLLGCSLMHFPNESAGPPKKAEAVPKVADKVGGTGDALSKPPQMLEELDTSGQQAMGINKTKAFAVENNPFVSMAYMQGRVLSIRHSHYCKHEKCPVAPMKCQYYKKLLEHILECPLSQECRIKRCWETKLILAHYRDCKAPMCPLCSPVLSYVHRLAKKSGQEQKQLISKLSAPTDQKETAKPSSDKSFQKKPPPEAKNVTPPNHQKVTQVPAFQNEKIYLPTRADEEAPATSIQPSQLKRHLAETFDLEGNDPLYEKWFVNKDKANPDSGTPQLSAESSPRKKSRINY